MISEFEFICIAVVLAIVVSQIKLWIELEAMKRSTHQITYIDPWKDAIKNFTQGTEFESMTEETREKIKKEENLDYDNVG